ncbi:MAG: nicotinamide mononucleotide transporter [Lachnospiraceae bacterium]|nr:nicotinamide mononucleotide transporter [Lachnospiraceae bacterium]
MWKEELKGWKKWEVVWLVISCLAIMGLSVYWKDSVMGIISATTGVACVVCTGKGKLSAYVFGIVNILLYAIISFQAKYYGEVMLNVIYYIPMQFYGFYVWKKNMNQETHEVKKRRMSKKSFWLLLEIIAIATLIYGTFLKYIGGSLSYVDALSTVVSVVAMAISVKMYLEQWILWLVVDSVTVIMWAVAFANGSDSIATLLMWIVYLGNAIVMYIKWAKEVKENEV